MDWVSDPELKAMLDEFVASLPVRREKLSKLRKELMASQGPRQREAADEICRVSHALAGTAETYGFPLLTRISGALDDYLSESDEARSEPCPAARIAEFTGFLVEALGLAERGSDPAGLVKDPRFQALMDAAPGEPTSGA